MLRSISITCFAISLLSVYYFCQYKDYSSNARIRCTTVTGTNIEFKTCNENNPHIHVMCDADIRKQKLLTPDGYLEFEDILNQIYKMSRRCKFAKMRINKSIVISSLLRNLTRALLHVAKSDNGMLITYLLIISGIEQNPGPADNNGHERRDDNVRERKRFRKSGLTYKTYLTNRSSFEEAPEELKIAIENMAQSSKSPTSNTAELSTCSSAMTEDEDILDGNYSPDSLNGDTDDSEPEFESDIEFLDSDSEPDDSETIADGSLIDEDFDKMLIYEDAQLTVGASVLLIMTFVMKYNLTGDAFSDLIELVQLHCKESNLIPESTYSFKQWFRDLKINPNKHYYCGNCLISIDDDCQICPNTKCNKRFRGKDDRCFFVEVSLIEQLKKLLSQSDFRKKLINPFERCQTSNIISDIFDGKFYQSMLSQKKLKPGDLTFTWNTDGVPLFKSSKSSMWPFFLAVNELPYKIRRNPENLLLVGLWIGPKKPEMLTFLRPFIKDFEELENGIEVNTDAASDTRLLHGYLISGTADLPAKCTVHNMIQFNGKYSCPACEQPGETASSGKGISHVFPFKFDGPTSPKRSHRESLIQAEMATNTGKTTFGIKGPCWFTHLLYYDFVKSNCIDYMHCVLLGVTKRLISLWFSKDHSKKPYSYFKQVDCVNKRISKMKPPLFVKRAPRSLSELKYWKASEYRSFLLFYGPVVLVDILTASHYGHFLLLSESIYILLKESIKEQELHSAENMLEHFIASFSNLYEPRFLTLNFHLLLHLPENVRQLGPIWGYSCFPFEDSNGYLMKLVKGTQSVHSQLLDSVSILHGLPYLEKNCIQQSSKADQLLNRMKRRSCKNSTLLFENVFALGKVTKTEVDVVSQDCYVALANFFGTPPSGNIYKFKRIKFNGNVLHSREYTRVKVRNSYTVCFKENNGTLNYGLVNYYIMFETDDARNKFILAILTKLMENTTIQPFPYDHVIEEQQMQHFKVFYEPDFTQQSRAVLINNIEQLCVLMKSDNGDVFTCRPPNSVEME